MPTAARASRTASGTSRGGARAGAPCRTSCSAATSRRTSVARRCAHTTSGTARGTSAWYSPARAQFVHLVARPDGDGIVIEGATTDGAQPRALELRLHRAAAVPLAGPLLGGRRRHVAAAAGDARDASAALTGAVQRRVAPVRAARASSSGACRCARCRRTRPRMGRPRRCAGGPRRARPAASARLATARYREALDDRRPVARHARRAAGPPRAVRLDGRRDGQRAGDGVQAACELVGVGGRRRLRAGSARRRRQRVEVARRGRAGEVVLARGSAPGRRRAPARSGSAA